MTTEDFEQKLRGLSPLTPSQNYEQKIDHLIDAAAVPKQRMNWALAAVLVASLSLNAWSLIGSKERGEETQVFPQPASTDVIFEAAPGTRTVSESVKVVL